MQQNATPGDEPTTPAGDQAEALEPVQEIALTALLAGRPITEAAAVAGCHRSTVYRWLQDDSLFVARLNASRREIADQARAELLALGTAAVAAIRETLENT